MWATYVGNYVFLLSGKRFNSTISESWLHAGSAGEAEATQRELGCGQGGAGPGGRGEQGPRNISAIGTNVIS